jgi:hypothetical protein
MRRNLDGDVVVAAAPVSFVHDRLRGAVELGCMLVERARDEARIDEFVGAVGCQDKGVTGLDLDRLVVDLELRVDAERAAEIGLLRRHDDAVIVGQLLERLAGDAVDAAVADMEDVRGGRLDDHGAEGADIALVAVIGILALARLRMQPGIGCVEHAAGGGLHRPGFRRAVIVHQEALDRRLAGDLAHRAAGDAVGENRRDALQAEQRLLRNQDAVKILVDGLATPVGVLADRNQESAGHRHHRQGGASPCSGEAPLSRRCLIRPRRGAAWSCRPGASAGS